MTHPNTERDSLPIEIIVDQMRDDYEGRHWIDEQDFIDRDVCLSKMAAAMTLAIEFDEAAANTEEGAGDG